MTWKVINKRWRDLRWDSVIKSGTLARLGDGRIVLFGDVNEHGEDSCCNGDCLGLCGFEAGVVVVAIYDLTDAIEQAKQSAPVGLEGLAP